MLSMEDMFLELLMNKEVSQQMAMATGKSDSLGAPGRGRIDQTIEYKQSRLTRFGQTLAANTYEHSQCYMMVGRADEGTINPSGGFSASTHYTARMIYEITMFFENVEDDNLTFSSTYFEYACMRMGRIARRLYQGYTRLTHLSQANLTSWFGATWDEYFQELYWAIGASLDKMFGKWSRLTNRRIDDAVVGAFIMARDKSEDMSLWYYSQGDILNKNVVWQTGDGMGEYIPFNRKVKSTWHGVLYEYNATGLLGLDPDLINDPDVRKFQVPILKGSSKRAARILSSSSLYWKFGREVMIYPIYCIQSPGADTGVGAQNSYIAADFGSTGTYKWRLHASASQDIDHKSLTKWYKDMVATIESTWLERRAMVPQKSMWEYRLVNELTIGKGNGGFLWYQLATYIDNGAGRDYVGTIASYTTQNTLMNIEQRLAEDTDDTADYWYQVMGDNVSNEDYRLFYGRMCYYINGELIIGKPLTVWGFFYFGIKKTEHREVMDETVYLDHENMGTTYAIPPWRYDATPKDGSGNTIANKLDTQTRSDRFAERSFDPWKKVEHWEYDLKHLDVDLVAQEVADYFCDDAEMIASSAPAKQDDKKKEEEEKKKENKEKAIEDKKKADEKKKKEKEAKKKVASSAPPGTIEDVATSAPDGNVNNRIMDNNDDGNPDVASKPLEEDIEEAEDE